MLILIGVTLAAAAFALIVMTSAVRRTGGTDMGSVSTQWLSEHREYQDGMRSR